MIEAVNSVVSSAPTLRGAVEQASTARSLAANPARVQEVASSAPELPKAPYISPYISLDYNYDRAVLQIRDSDTGDVVEQFPTESRLAEQQRAKLAAEQATQRLRRPEQREARPTNDALAAEAKKAPAPIEAKASDIVTVQEATSTPAANSAAPTHIAAAALSAGASTALAGRGSVSSVLA